VTGLARPAVAGGPPRWAVARVASAVAAQRAGAAGQAGIDVRRLAREVGLSRGLASACLRVVNESS